MPRVRASNRKLSRRKNRPASPNPSTIGFGPDSGAESLVAAPRRPGRPQTLRGWMAASGPLEVRHAASQGARIRGGPAAVARGELVQWDTSEHDWLRAAARSMHSDRHDRLQSLMRPLLVVLLLEAVEGSLLRPHRLLRR